MSGERLRFGVAKLRAKAAFEIGLFGWFERVIDESILIGLCIIRATTDFMSFVLDATKIVH